MTSKRAQIFTHVATYIALLIISVLAIFPLLWMLSTSLKPDYQVV